MKMSRRLVSRQQRRNYSKELRQLPERRRQDQEFTLLLDLERRQVIQLQLAMGRQAILPMELLLLPLPRTLLLLLLFLQLLRSAVPTWRLRSLPREVPQAREVLMARQQILLVEQKLELLRLVAMVALFYLSGILMYVIGDAADWVDAYFSVNSAGVDVRDVAGKVKPPILDCIVEGLWFATMVFTTIGYGDVYPESSALRLFEVFYVLLGVGVMGSLVADVVTSQVESSLKAFEKRQLAAALQGVGVDSSSVGRTTPGRMGEQDAEAAIAGARARMAFQEGATIVVGLILGFALLFGGLQGWEPIYGRWGGRGGCCRLVNYVICQCWI
eukprot:g12823.t1